MRALKGHTRDVRAVAYTPDGRLASGGGADRCLRVWTPTTGECGTVVKAKGPVYAVAASPDGKAIAHAGRPVAGAQSNFVYLCDPAGKPLGRCELRTEGHRWEWNPATGVSEWIVAPEARSIWSLAFSADGDYLAAACRRIGGGNQPDGGGGRCWPTAPAAGRPEVPLPTDVFAVAFAPTGNRLAVTRLRSVAFHDDPTGPERMSCPLPGMWTPAVAFVPGADLAVAASNSFVCLVNPVRVQRVARLKTGIRTVTGLAVSPDGKTVLVGGRPGNVEVYDVATRTRTATYDFGIGGLHALAFAPDGLTFAAAGDNGLVVCDAAG